MLKLCYKNLLSFVVTQFNYSDKMTTANTTILKFYSCHLKIHWPKTSTRLVIIGKNFKNHLIHVRVETSKTLDCIEQKIIVVC